mgnify:CR=1 FL=1
MEDRNMIHKYQGIRISVCGRPTYGDKYRTIISEKRLTHNDIVDYGNERILILFEEENND